MCEILRTSGTIHENRFVYKSRSELKGILDDVTNDADIIIITRRDSKDAVIMPMDHYNSLMKTVHLLGSFANADHLNRSIKQFQAAKTSRRDITDEKKVYGVNKRSCKSPLISYTHN